MGRLMRSFKQKMQEKFGEQLDGVVPGASNFFINDQDGAQSAFESGKPDCMKKDIMMISGCEDAQTSADVKNVEQFSLPDPAGRSGGACTSTLLKVLYDEGGEGGCPNKSFTEVLEMMRENLQSSGYTQIPQLTSLNPIDVSSNFRLVSDDSTGTRRAVMIGINYIGHESGVLSGCQNDILNFKKYIMDCQGFDEENIVVLLDDGEHESPTGENIMNAYRQVIADSEEGDTIFLHYAGHGTKVRDTNGDEDDGFDEALVPIDYQENGLLIDDDLFDVLIAPLPDGVHMVSLMDCCHSGTILDLPYVFQPNAGQSSMKLNDAIDLDGLVEQFGGQAMGLVVDFFQKRSLSQNNREVEVDQQNGSASCAPLCCF